MLSINGVPIRLTEERWFHIVKHHPELKKLQKLVLRTVAEPEFVFLFSLTRDLAAVSEYPDLQELGLASSLVVHYKEASDRGGFIVTAYPMSLTRMRRKFLRWQRLK